MATWPLAEYTEEMEAERILRAAWGDLASATAELDRLRREIAEAMERLAELRDLLDAAPEAMVYQLRVNLERLCYEVRPGSPTG
jgi:chromosome segregation ATPase